MPTPRYERIAQIAAEKGSKVTAEDAKNILWAWQQEHKRRKAAEKKSAAQ